MFSVTLKKYLAFCGSCKIANFGPLRKYTQLEFQGPTGPLILAPAVRLLATLKFGLASLNFFKLSEGVTYIRTNELFQMEEDLYNHTG